MLNKVQIIGNLGADPDVSSNENSKVARLSVATSSKWKDKNTGEIKTDTEWHRVVFFGKTADVVERYLKKGGKVYVEGKLKTSKYTDKNGVEKYSTDIIGSVLTMLGGSDQSASSGQDVSSPPSINAGEDDLPF